MKKTKKILTTLAVLTGVFFLGWLGVFLSLGIMDLVNPADMLAGVYLQMHWESFLAALFFSSAVHPLWVSIVVVSLLGLTLILSIVWIVVAISKKRGTHAFWVFLFILFMVVALDLASMLGVGNETSPIYIFSYWSLMTQTSNILIMILGIAMFALAVLSIVFTLCTYIYGLSAMVKHPGGANEALAEEELGDDLAEEAPIYVSEDPAAVPEFVVEAEPSFEPADLKEEPAEEVEEKKEEDRPLVQVFVEQPEPAPVAEEPKTEPAKEEAPALDVKAIAEMIRDIVRDEIARSNLATPTNTSEENSNSNSNNQTKTQNVTGATFGGPLIVQYFNGFPTQQQAAAQQMVTPAPQPEPAPQPTPKAECQPEPSPAPANEEVKVEPAKEEEPAVVAEPAPEAAQPVEEKAKTPIVRIPFDVRLLDSEKELQDSYNELKNELLSWGLKSRVSSSGDTFRLHRKTYVKVIVAGKSLKLYMALDPADYADSKIPVQDASEKNLYVDIPLVFKVKSPLSLRRAKQLIQDACEKDGLSQAPVESINWIKELKADLKERQKAEK